MVLLPMPSDDSAPGRHHHLLEQYASSKRSSLSGEPLELLARTDTQHHSPWTTIGARTTIRQSGFRPSHKNTEALQCTSTQEVLRAQFPKRNYNVSKSQR